MSVPVLRIGLLLLLPVFALAYFLGAYFFYYRGDYDPPPTATVSFERLALPVSSQASFTEVPQVHRGTLLVDGGHRNDFSKGEISSFLSKIAARGHDIDFIGEPATFGGFRGLDPDIRFDLMEEKLRRAHSLAVILPDAPYLPKEADLVERFVENGGRLLLIADPTRRNQINSLAERFGIAFQPDYLYNTVEYDLNFENIFIRDFVPDSLTNNLRQIALYTTGSVKSAGPGLAYADANTQSSVVERIEAFYPIVKGHDDRVLAIADFTFMVPPQNSILDNDQFLSNIADFLTTSQREFDLADFPYFFEDDVDILLGRSSLFDLGTATKALLAEFQVNGVIVGAEDITRDMVYLGLYRDAADVAHYLGVAGIQVDESLRTPFTPAIDPSRTAIVLLHQTPDRRVLTILGDSEPAVADIVDQLAFGDFRDGLVSDFVGVYRTP